MLIIHILFNQIRFEKENIRMRYPTSLTQKWLGIKKPINKENNKLLIISNVQNYFKKQENLKYKQETHQKIYI